jgi:ABC-type multidrug transport system ATPase subunit
MSEKILQALMQLFAIGAALERLTLQSREVVENFLRQQVSLQRVDEYLRLFDEFNEKYSGGSDDVTRARKKIAFSSVRALRICTEINKELNTRQKYIVFLRLAEFMHSSELELTEPEKEFLDTVANVFNISPEEHELCQKLAFRNSVLTDFDSANVLIVSSKKENELKNAHHLFHEDLDGHMIFLYLKEGGIFFLRYNGQDIFIANGQPVDIYRSTVITQGAVIRCSRLKPLYYRDLILPFLASRSEDPFKFTAKNIDFIFPNGKQGLHNINFSVNSGNLTGIMGGSGAGKSTLLNVLNGSNAPTKGQVLINGKDIYEENIAEGLIGNIPQDDLLIEELTVYQNLYYNTRLCFGELSEEEINTKVLDVLDALGLSETKDLKVGNVLNKTISGGQRKRLNIGLELVREPSILFVDEPTSGLSSRDAENVMDLLKQLALSGKLIFVVIHQPSSDIFRLFDQLFMLDTGGYPVYFGNPADALIYFKRMVHLTDAEQSECSVCGNINPEQLFNIIELHEVDEFGRSTNNRKVTPKEWYKLYQNLEIRTEDHVKDELNVKKNRKANPFNQWKIFFTRDLLSRLSNRQYLLINLLEAPLLALILGFILRFSSATPYQLISNPNLPAFLFIGVIVSLFMGLSVSAEEIIRDRKIRQREKFLHLSKTSYFLSKVSLLFLISAIQTLCFVVIGNQIMGIHDMNMTYWLILFSTSCFANLLGLNISAAMDSAVTVYILIPFLLIPQILLSGVIVRYDKLHPLFNSNEGVPLIGNIMTSRWSYEALAVEQFANNPFENQFYNDDALMSQATYKKDWWISALKEKAARIERCIIDKAPRNTVMGAVEFLRNELSKESGLSASKKSQLLSYLDATTIDQPKIQSIKNELDALTDHYIDLYNSANEKKEARIAKMSSTKAGEELFARNKNRYENESLEDLVRNSNQAERVVILNDRIIQRFEPIFHDNQGEAFLKAPMFSYTKNLFGTKTKTLCANLLVIWGMTFSLYLMLQVDLFRKVINFFSKNK